MKQQIQLIESIISNKKIQSQELFNYLITKKAQEKLQEFKINLAKSLYK